MTYHSELNRTTVGCVFMFLSLVALTVPACASAVSKPVDCRVSVLNIPNLPIHVSGVTITESPGRQLSAVNFKISNESGSRLNDFGLVVTFSNQAHELLGGEGVHEQGIALDAGASKDFSVALRHYVAPGTLVSLVVARAVTDNGSWKLQNNDLLTGAQAADLSLAPPLAVFGGAASSTPDVCDIQFCNAALEDATKACGSRGIQSFSCNACTYQFSFTCNH